MWTMASVINRITYPMKNLLVLPLLVVIITFASPYISVAQLIGRWTAMGDMDYKPKAIIQIYEEDGKLHGRVEKILPAATTTICKNCDGDLKNKPIAGMVILTDLVKTETGGKDGKILDPGSGNTYSCYLELESPDKLKLRGYIGLPAFGRTQYWFRVKDE
jgi:uncharacterized protein (DUF2147 family)